MVWTQTAANLALAPQGSWFWPEAHQGQDQRSAPQVLPFAGGLLLGLQHLIIQPKHAEAV